jgi:hypothetical protein
VIDSGRLWLTAAAAMSGAAAFLHLAVIVGGPRYYRFFGAGERMARLAEQGSAKPALVTIGIAAVLAIWSAYALAGAGLIPRLPLMRTALVAIASVYLFRGLILFPALVMNGGRVGAFLMWSSLIVLVYGLTYAVGTFLAWPALAARAS